MPESLLLEQYDAVGMVTSKFLFILFYFIYYCSFKFCACPQLVKSLMKFWSLEVGGGWAAGSIGLALYISPHSQMCRVNQTWQQNRRTGFEKVAQSGKMAAATFENCSR